MQYIHIALMLRYQCPSVCPPVRLSVKEVHWRIIPNLGFKFQSKFTAQRGGVYSQLRKNEYTLSGRSLGGAKARRPDSVHTCVHAGKRGEVISTTTSRAMLATARPSCWIMRTTSYPTKGKVKRVCATWIYCIAAFAGSK